MRVQNRARFQSILIRIRKEQSYSKLQKMLLERDLRRLMSNDYSIQQFGLLTDGDLMKQTDTCAKCGHTLMMHTGGPCQSCTKCAAFQPRRETLDASAVSEKPEVQPIKNQEKEDK